MNANLMKIGPIIASLVAYKQWRFQLGSEEVTGEQMGDEGGFLPMILWNADQIYRKGFERELGMRVEASEEGFLGMRVAQTCRTDVPTTVLSLCCREALEQMVLHSHPELAAEGEEQDASAIPPIQIDDFVNEFLQVATGPEFNLQLPARVLELVQRSSAQPAMAAN